MIDNSIVNDVENYRYTRNEIAKITVKQIQPLIEKDLLDDTRGGQGAVQKENWLNLGRAHPEHGENEISDSLNLADYALSLSQTN